MSCVFCKIANKEMKSSIVDETERAIAFDDVNPQAPVHVVIIPKEHILNISGLSDVLPEIFGTITRVAEKKSVKDTGYRVVLNIGKDSGQAVSHLHFHLLGGRPLKWPPG
jgi:histidine triad (HIT) family protein